MSYKMNCWRIIIPTRDSERWIGAFIDAYRAIDVEPLYIFDVRSADNTIDVLRTKKADFVEYCPSDDFVEAGMIEFGSHKANVEWILRLDDDEFPSIFLIHAMEHNVVNSQAADAFFISTREVFAWHGNYFFSRAKYRYWSPLMPSYLNSHLRIHRASAVKYISEMHGYGFEVKGPVSYLPEQAFHIHCSSVLRTFDERLQKVKRYELKKRGGGYIHADEYLPELIDFASHDASDDGLSEFYGLLNRIHMQSSPEQNICRETMQAIDDALRLKMHLYYSYRGGQAKEIDVVFSSLRQVSDSRFIVAPSLRAIILVDTAIGGEDGAFTRSHVIFGETLIDRTIRLLRQNGVNQIFVSSSDVAYSDKHVMSCEQRGDDNSNMFIRTADVWNTKGETLFVTADSYFSEEAMRFICCGTPAANPLGVQFFGRMDAEDHDVFRGSVFAIRVLFHEKLMKICSDPGKILTSAIKASDFAWEIYSASKAICPPPDRERLLRRISDTTMNGLNSDQQYERFLSNVHALKLGDDVARAEQLENDKLVEEIESLHEQLMCSNQELEKLHRSLCWSILTRLRLVLAWCRGIYEKLG